jgi:hypothetical protein
VSSVVQGTNQFVEENAFDAIVVGQEKLHAERREIMWKSGKSGTEDE